jgi:predicted amidophosphoribosyltransferase
MKDAGALWPARRIAEELLRRGLGGEARNLLVRHEPIEKSALQRVGSKRPSPEDHIRTIAVEDPFQVRAHRIVLVDDVVTRGSTLLGCATLLLRVLPSVQVFAFAAVRTMSDMEIEHMLAPVTGKIRLTNGRLHREP